MGININHERGIYCEKLVEQHLKSKGLFLIASRLKTPFGEIDLVFKIKNQIYIVEVKSLASIHFLNNTLKYSQKKRIQRASQYLFEKYDLPVNILFVTVDKENKISIYNWE